MKKIVEKHVTIEKSVFEKLKTLATKEARTMRAVLTRLINKAFEEHKNEEQR